MLFRSGRNWARVVIARFLTAGRGWFRTGVSTVTGCGSTLDRYAGKRVTKIDRIASVSMRVSGGVFDCKK